MKTFFAFTCALWLSACTTLQGNPSPSPINDQSIQIMVLGTYHFKASQTDLVAIEAGNVLSPKKQSELNALAIAMAEFKPNVIITERETKAPEYIDTKYADFGPEMLAKNSNERVQVAYRIAHVANVTRVYGIDEQPTEGEPDYFPFDTLNQHAKATGQDELLAEILATLQNKVEMFMEETEDMTISVRLHDVNTGLISSPSFYYQLAQFDIGEDQPAAELQAYWFMRNAKIFSKIMDVTKPGDKVIIVYGAGHKFWLDHFVQNTPGFTHISPASYLLNAEKYNK
ncbi:MAG: hypothetical protein COA69_02020 [Robiginitomaculum sp.]|nr:MAG: hypothetical protein COA69_02020 [Robiginitomaculum sp.]